MQESGEGIALFRRFPSQRVECIAFSSRDRASAATRGEAWRASLPTIPWEALSIVDDRLVVSFTPYFAGQRLTVLLRAQTVA